MTDRSMYELALHVGNLELEIAGMERRLPEARRELVRMWLLLEEARKKAKVSDGVA